MWEGEKDDDPIIHNMKPENNTTPALISIAERERSVKYKDEFNFISFDLTCWCNFMAGDADLF